MRQAIAFIAIDKIICGGNGNQCNALRVLPQLVTFFAFTSSSSPAALCLWLYVRNQKLKVVSQKATSIAAVNWLACYPQSPPCLSQFLFNPLLANARINRTSSIHTETKIC